jgi:hypothetical protein
MQVAIYTKSSPERFLATLQRRIKNAEIRAWEVRAARPLALVHAGERYAKIRVTFAGATPARRLALGTFATPAPALVATIKDGASADRVLGFLVGMLTRHAEPLGVSGVGIPLGTPTPR